MHRRLQIRVVATTGLRGVHRPSTAPPSALRRFRYPSAGHAVALITTGIRFLHTPSPPAPPPPPPPPPSDGGNGGRSGDEKTKDGSGPKNGSPSDQPTNGGPAPTTTGEAASPAPLPPTQQQQQPTTNETQPASEAAGGSAPLGTPDEGGEAQTASPKQSQAQPTVSPTPPASAATATAVPPRAANSPPPKGFEVVFKLPFDRKADTSVSGAQVMSDVERGVLVKVAQHDQRSRYMRISFVMAAATCVLAYRSWSRHRSMLPPYAEDGTRRFAAVLVQLQKHCANFLDTAGNLISYSYFVDYNAFEQEVLGEENPAPIYIAVSTYFPFAPLLLLLLIPVLGFFQDSLRMASRLATTAGPMAEKSKFKFKKETTIRTRLCDVAGMTEAKFEVNEIIDFLRNPDRYRKLGAKVPKGIMMEGPPGVGKTLLAKAIAGEAGLPFLSCSGSEFEEVYVGVGAMRIRELFKQARAARPCVVFIDEIDAFGKKRSGGRGGSRGTLNAFLSEMDGFNESANILVLAATNRYDVLDNALTRAGRFDRKITLEKPPHKDRVEIAKVHVKNLTLDAGLTLDDVAETLASMTPGCSGADIYNICNEAAIIASRENRESVNMACFHRAMERVLVGMEKKAKKIAEHERKRLAFHESGHVVLGWFQTDTDPIIKASIAPRGGDKMGVTQKLPVDAYISTQGVLRQKMVQQLGGYVAEEAFFHDLSTRAADDLRSVTEFAWHEVCTYGMDPVRVGHFHFERDDNAVQKPYGPDKEDTIDLAVASVVETALIEARRLLQEHLHHVRVIAGLLLKSETMTAQDLWLALGERPNMTKEFRAFLEA